MYHYVIPVYKIIQEESPSYLYSMFSAKFNYNTKQAQSGSIRHTRNLKLDITESSFRWRAASSYDEILKETKELKTLKEFKTAVRKWIMETVPLE